MGDKYSERPPSSDLHSGHASWDPGSTPCCELYLVRHGQTNENKHKIVQGHLNNSLNNQGRQQVILLLDRMQNMALTFEGVYCSDLPRCTETFQLLNQGLSCEPVRFLSGLRERDYGDLSGSWVDVARDYSFDGYAWSGALSLEKAPGGETFSEFGDRVISMFKEISSVPGRYLVVTHGGVLNILYRHTQRLPLSVECPEREWPNASLSKLTVEPGNLLQHQWKFDLAKWQNVGKTRGK